jgi:hypothetical protein
LRAGEAVFAPRDLGRAATPGLCSKIGQYRSANFRSKPLWCAITITASSTKAVTAASLIRCPATISSVMPVSGDLRDRVGRLAKGGEDVSDANDAAVRQIVELDHAELDEFVLAMIEAGGFDVEEIPVLASCPATDDARKRGTTRRSTRKSTDRLSASAIAAKSDVS